jgi:hypothetical protein
MNAQLKYSDIINLPHHVSSKHPHLSREQKAAQFAPFSALTGLDEDVKETARLTDRRIEIDDGLKEILSNKLNIIDMNIKNKPFVQITYFIKDSKKQGGKYVEVEGIVKKINIFDNYLLLNDNTKISIIDIIDIKSDLFKGMNY